MFKRMLVCGRKTIPLRKNILLPIIEAHQGMIGLFSRV
jgi:hypothetical protein